MFYKHAPKKNEAGSKPLQETLLADPLELFLNVPFFFSIFSALAYSFLAFSEKGAVIVGNLLSLSPELFSISIGAIGLILAALALILVVFNRKTMHLAAKKNVFQGTLLPYVINSLSWCGVSLISLFYILLEEYLTIKTQSILSIILFFLLIYSITYLIRVILSIISYSILSATKDDGED